MTVFYHKLILLRYTGQFNLLEYLEIVGSSPGFLFTRVFRPFTFTLRHTMQPPYCLVIYYFILSIGTIQHASGLICKSNSEVSNCFEISVRCSRVSNTTLALL